jgi:hypothetical protein
MSPLLSRFRLLFAIAVLVALATALVACGGDDNGGGSGEDPQKVLDQTFSGDHEKVNSGNLSIKFNLEATGDDGGTLDAELSGPFESEGENKVPKFDLTANASLSGSQDDDFSFDGSLTSTGDAAFIGFEDTDYEVDQSLFDRFKQQVESATGQGGENEQSSQQLLDALGIKDPQSLLTNLTNEGTEDVEGTETTHISGDLDVAKTVDAFKNLISNASLLGQLGGSTSELPDPEDLDQVTDAIKEAHFDIYSGTDDHILRRITIALSIEPPSGSTDKVDLDLDFTLGQVNEPQTIEAPSGAKPFNDLLQELGVPAAALGQLGALGGGGGSGGNGGGGGSTTPTLPSTPDTDAAQKYLNCISQASSAADLQECQSLAP